MQNMLDYKIAFVVLLAMLGIIILFPFACYFVINKTTLCNRCNRNRIVDLPENNLPV
jgi:hypothetical protein